MHLGSKREGKVPVNLKNAFAIASLFVALTGCGSEGAGDFKINLPADPGLRSKTETVLPAILKTCPGLKRYGNDLGFASVNAGSMRGYEGGIEITFAVIERPQRLPSSIRTVSAGQTCYINVKPDRSKIYIGKTACHSICDGTAHENDPGLMGREIALEN